MPSVDVFLAFSLACLVLSLSPGPSNMYIMARSISQGSAAGVAAAGGLAIGSIIYALLTAMGLATIFVYTPTAYMALKLAGAAYLLYLGWQYFTAPPVSVSTTDNKPHFSHSFIFRQSIIVELTNPKTALFFLAFLPQFADESAPLAPQLLILGLLYALIAMCCDLFVAFLSAGIGRWLNQHPRYPYWQDKISGSILMGLGAYIGISEVLVPEKSH